MKYTRLLCASFLFSTISLHVSAASTIKSIELQNNLALIQAYPEKVTGSATCADDDKKHIWAVDISALKGEKLYALLLGALSEQTPVTFIPARDCLNTKGYERLNGIAIKSH